ncbi:MAG: tRNA pseudouridine(54/55) synthase Pus10 [Candidatus Lokiarchaeota archaeon]|nr:tRNA pseudouridine(54/55) synthase Pus10 [Candidatus Lokiarchaeota archaeon]
MAGLTEIVKQLLGKNAMCDHCLGRQFAALGTGIENGHRGMVLRQGALLDAHGVLKEKAEALSDPLVIASKEFVIGQAASGHPLAMRLAKQLNVVVPGTGVERNAGQTTTRDVAIPPAVMGGVITDADLKIPWEWDGCALCGGVFSRRVQDIAVGLARHLGSSIEFHSFLVGSRFSTSVLEREEEMRVERDLKWGELIKSHFNRFVGAAISKALDKPVDFKNPDIVLLFSIENKDSIGLEEQINPYFIYGKYRKLVRGIPQTHWPHRACRGAGCEGCNFTGKQYQESVEDLITPPFLSHTGGTALRFHGAGREDIDALMLGEGRPFVVEILNGKKRTLDYVALEAAVNAAGGGKVEVAGLRPSTNDEMQALKGEAPDTRKRYKATCTLEKPIDDATLMSIKEQLEGARIDQQTPQRVAHRRADKTRHKHVYAVTWERVENPLEIVFYIEAEGGTYIKELISSDEGRTRPSISGLAGQKMACKTLDVLEVRK